MKKKVLGEWLVSLLQTLPHVSLVGIASRTKAAFYILSH